MFGKNPIRPPIANDGTTLQVVNIFPTLQGEGPFVGYPAIFVRLGGCNLACHFCDTEFESFNDMGLDDIVTKVEGLAKQSPQSRTHNLVVITGGEPLRQNIAPLCERLIASGFMVQIETNGTLWRELPAGVHIICSPKQSNGVYHSLRSDLLARVNALKFIISADHASYHDVAEVGQAAHSIPVYVQPMDEHNEKKNMANRAYAAALAQRHGYRLSLQMHKILGIE